MVLVHKKDPAGTVGIDVVHPVVGFTVPEVEDTYSIFVLEIPTPSFPAIPSVPLLPSFALYETV